MKSPESNATQEFVPIKEIRDGIIVLKDGGMRAIIMASSLNFALKSADEQNAIVLQFQNFLNSLDFSVQFFIQSKKLDIRPYIALLEDKYKEQVNELMKIQTREYIEFIRTFTEQQSIMSKSFFVVIPYSPSIVSGKSNPISKMLNRNQTEATATTNFEESRSQLEQRVSVVEQGLVRCGIKVVPLGTEEIVELFYKIFNPGETDKPIHLN
ncbi:MAG: hypothetical protein Q7R78_01280 [bacterium]|nr:hypothetical protein [bacterium]